MEIKKLVRMSGEQRDKVQFISKLIKSSDNSVILLAIEFLYKQLGENIKGV